MTHMGNLGLRWPHLLIAQDIVRRLSRGFAIVLNFGSFAEARSDDARWMTLSGESRLREAGCQAVEEEGL